MATTPGHHLRVAWPTTGAQDVQKPSESDCPKSRNGSGSELRIGAQAGQPPSPFPLPLLPPIRNGIFILSFGTQSPGNPLCNSGWLTEHRKGSSLGGSDANISLSPTTGS